MHNFWLHFHPISPLLEGAVLHLIQLQTWLGGGGVCYVCNLIYYWQTFASRLKPNNE